MRRERINILFGGLAGFISIAFLQLLSIGEIEESTRVYINYAIGLFSFSLPLSIFYVLSANEHLKITKINVPVLYEYLAVITLIAGFAGIALLFCYFGITYAIILCIVSFGVLVTFNFLDRNKNNYFTPVKRPTKRMKVKEKADNKNQRNNVKK